MHDGTIVAVEGSTRGMFEAIPQVSTWLAIRHLDGDGR